MTKLAPIADDILESVTLGLAIALLVASIQFGEVAWLNIAPGHSDLWISKQLFSHSASIQAASHTNDEIGVAYFGKQHCQIGTSAGVVTIPVYFVSDSFLDLVGIVPLNRTGFLGGLISWEDGVYGTSKSVFPGGT